MLRDGESLAAAAAEAGFADQARMTRRFRQVYGLPPGRRRSGASCRRVGRRSRRRRDVPAPIRAAAPTCGASAGAPRRAGKTIGAGRASSDWGGRWAVAGAVAGAVARAVAAARLHRAGPMARTTPM